MVGLIFMTNDGENLVIDLFKEALQAQAKNMEEFKKEVKENFSALNNRLDKNDDKLTAIDKRFSEMEMNIRFIKSIFINSKFWITVIILIVFLITAFDPHNNILRTIKEIYGVFN